MVPIDKSQAEALLKRYFDGETSLEEERGLREYLCGAEDVPEDLEYARMMFSAFAEASAEGGGVIAGKELSMRNRLNRLRRRIVVAAVSAAAIAAIMVVLLLPRERQTVYCYIDGRPVTDYEEAYGYTQDALQVVSKSFNTSLSSLEKFNDVLEILLSPGNNDLQKH